VQALRLSQQGDSVVLLKPCGRAGNSVTYRFQLARSYSFLGMTGRFLRR
jgi:hypothetical protein